MNSMTGIMRIFRTALNDRKIPLWGKCVLLVIGLSLMGAGAFIAPSAWGLDPVQKEALIASLPRGEVFENDGSTYVFLPTLWAEKRGGHEVESLAGPNSGEVVEQKGLFRVYRGPLEGVPSIRGLRAESGAGSVHPVVLNLKTQSLGIITGNLWLKFKNMGDAQSVADAYGISLSFVNAAMSTAFYEVPAGVDILTLRKRLETDPRVVRVTLDMVDRLRHPH
jgi:hypothetical protein